MMALGMDEQVMTSALEIMSEQADILEMTRL
jgi:hypothetical protein